jgi:hypothetical protein
LYIVAKSESVWFLLLLKFHKIVREKKVFINTMHVKKKKNKKKQKKKKKIVRNKSKILK